MQDNNEQRKNDDEKKLEAEIKKMAKILKKTDNPQIKNRLFRAMAALNLELASASRNTNPPIDIKPKKTHERHQYTVLRDRMIGEGYKSPTRLAAEIYSWIGINEFREVARTAFEYSIIEANVLGVKNQGKRFVNLEKNNFASLLEIIKQDVKKRTSERNLFSEEGDFIRFTDEDLSWIIAHNYNVGFTRYWGIKPNSAKVKKPLRLDKKLINTRTRMLEEGYGELDNRDILFYELFGSEIYSALDRMVRRFAELEAEHLKMPRFGEKYKLLRLKRKNIIFHEISNELRDKPKDYLKTPTSFVPPNDIQIKEMITQEYS